MGHNLNMSGIGYALKKSVYVCAARRTPFTVFQKGALANHKTGDLAIPPSKAALEDAGVKPEDVDVCVFGSVNMSDPGSLGIPRTVALNIGCKQSIPCLQLNRLCGSGFQSIATAS